MSDIASPDSQWIFVEETIPDNSQFVQGALFHKRWRIRNTGPATWDDSYTVKFIAGNAMSGPESIKLAHDVAPNQEVDITLLLNAPDEVGVHRGDWHIEDAQGRIVQSNTGGGNFWLIIETIVDMGIGGGAAPPEVHKKSTMEISIQAANDTEERVLKPLHLPDWQVGVNMRDFAYFDIRGIHDAKQCRTYQQQHIEKLAEVGVTTVRFYGCHMHFDANQCIDRIGQALHSLEEHDMKAVISLNDALAHSQLFVKGDEKYHTEPPEGYIHKSYFNDRKYYENYIPHISKVTQAFGNNDTVLLWELGNEYVTKPVGATSLDTYAFLEFARIASETVAGVASQRISLGLLNSHQISQTHKEGVIQYAKKLYGLPFIDLVTAHYYQNDGERPWALVDAQVAQSLSKPFYIGEMGTSHDFGERSGFYQRELDFWRNNGAFMVMPWGYSLNNQPYLDNRSIIGMHHPDFNQVVGTIQQFCVPI